MREKSPPRVRQSKTVTKSPVKKSVAYQETPIDVEAERQRQRELLIQQFRPSMVNLLNSKLDELGILPSQVCVLKIIFGFSGCFFLSNKFKRKVNKVLTYTKGAAYGEYVQNEA